MDFINNTALVYGVVAVCMLFNFISIPANIGNIIKRALGAIWIVAALLCEYTLFSEGMKKMSAATGAAGTQTVIQWSIILIIFTIVMIGLAIHGYYGVKGEYATEEA
jgi:hypothetical protein